MQPAFDYQPAYLDAAHAGALQQQLRRQAHWHQEALHLFGRSQLTPRLVCWYGDPGVGYRYSGAHHQARGWLRPLRELATQLSADLQAELPAPFNFVLLNCYRSGADAMGWHADNEIELGAQPVIASISLGATRRFRIRARAAAVDGRRESRGLDLANGSLLVMRRNSQRDFDHALVRTARPVAERVNLTFRYVGSA